MTEWKWIVVSGGFTGDGSSIHKLYRNENGDRILIFNSREAAEKHITLYKIGQHSMLAEVLIEACPATELRCKDGSRIYVGDK